MPVAIAPNGIHIEYDVMGDPSDPPLLWIMGFTAQLIAWPEEFMQLFVDLGYFVIRFDNRDCGLSTKLDGVVVDTNAVIKAALLEDPLPAVPYTLSDMANDAVAVLDHLGIARAHVIGASMGGMIAQTVAIEHPSRVQTLTSIMSQTGDPEYGQPDPKRQQFYLHRQRPIALRTLRAPLSTQYGNQRNILIRWPPKNARRESLIAVFIQKVQVGNWQQSMQAVDALKN